MPGAASSSTAAPNTALYIKNINPKVKKQELRRQLFALFVTYGKILDIVATRRQGMREQAFVVFADLASSTAALRALDGFSFYGQALAIDYAQHKSKATILVERGPEALFDPSLGFNMDGAGSSKKKMTFSSAGAELKGRERKRAREEAGQRSSDEDDDDESDESEAESSTKADGPPVEKRHKAETNGKNDGGAEEMQMADSDSENEDGGSLGAPMPAAGSVPNNLLFVDNLPAEVTEEGLSIIFNKHDGFSAVQILAARSDQPSQKQFAFAEFASTKHAAAAIKGLQGYKLPSGDNLAVAFAKRASA